MHVSLAPMEGVIDSPMRRLLTDIGGYDRCVTEFVRVTDVLLPERVFFRICPELAEGCRTASGTPIFVQLLGGQADALAVNAVRAAELGAAGIDLNFGCPAKTVNRSDGLRPLALMHCVSMHVLNNKATNPRHIGNVYQPLPPQLAN